MDRTVAREPIPPHSAGALSVEPGCRARATDSGPDASGRRRKRPPRRRRRLKRPRRPPPAARIPITGYELAGERIDADDKLHVAAALGRAARRAVHRVGAERSRSASRSAPSRAWSRRWTAIGYRADDQPAPAPGGGVTLVVDADPLRPRSLRLRQRQLAHPAGRDPAPHHHPPRPPAAARGRRARRRARARARARPRLPAQRGLLRGQRAHRRAAATNGRRRRSTCTSPSTAARPTRSGRSPSPATTRIPSEEIDPDVPAPGLVLRCGWRPVPFTQKQLRDGHRQRSTKRYRELGYFGARVTTDFSIQQSVDREREERPPQHPHQRAQADHRRVRGQHQRVVGRRCEDELTLLSRGSYDDYEVAASADAIQRYYQAARATSSRASTGGASACRPTRSGSSSTSTRGPSCRCAGSSSWATARCPRSELAEVVSVRTYPLAGPRRAAATSPAGRWSRTPSASSSTTRARGSSRPRRAPTPPPRRRRWGCSGAVAAGAETVVPRRRGRSTSASPIEEGPRSGARRRGLPHRRRRRPCPTTSSFLLESSPPRPGDPYTPAGGARRRPAAGAAARRRRLSRGHRRPRRQRAPAIDVDADLGVQAGAAHPGRPGLRARQLRDHARDDPRADPAPARATTSPPPPSSAASATSASCSCSTTRRRSRSRARRRSATVVPMVVEVEERYEQYSVLHVGAGASTEQKPPELVAAASASTLRAGYENRNLVRPRLDLHQPRSTYGTSLLRGNVDLPRPALLRHAVPLRRRAQLPAAGDRAPRRHPLGRRLDRLFARDVPGRRRRHSLQPAQHHPHRVAAARRRPRRDQRPGPPRHHRRQPVGERRVAAHGQPPGADARLPRRRARRAGAAGAVGAAAPVPARRRRRHLPQGGRALAVGAAARRAGCPCASASASTRASRWAARRCCPRSSATSRAATPPSAATSSIARASRWCATC